MRCGMANETHSWDLNKFYFGYRVYLVENKSSQNIWVSYSQDFEQKAWGVQSIDKIDTCKESMIPRDKGTTEDKNGIVFLLWLQ